MFRSSRCSGPTTAAVASSSGESSKRLRRISRTLSPTSPASDMRAGGEEEKSSGCGGSRLIAARERPGSTRPRAAAGASSRLRGQLWTLVERRWLARSYELQNGDTALSPLVFHRHGRPVGDFRKAWAAACAKANVPGRIFHDLRRFFARDAVRSGVPQSVVMEVGGWRTTSVFMRYDISSERDKRAALARTEAHRDEQTAESNVARFSRN